MGNLQTYMDNAVNVLQKYHVLHHEGEESQMAALLQQVVKVDEPKVLAIAKTVQYMGTFNELVRNNVEQVRNADRYNNITTMFDSIREDSKALAHQLEDGKIDFKEKFQNWVMTVSRGSVHKRFEKISHLYVDVSQDTRAALDRENEILGAYVNFRFAVKEAEILAHQVVEEQVRSRDAAQGDFAAKVKDVENFKGEQSEKGKLELARDVAQQAWEQEKSKYDLIKRVADNLTIGYQVGETLIAKLKQTHDVKEQVYQQAVTFFTTNEHVFTVMDAVYTSQHGLHEATETLEAMKAGANQGLEDIAELGTKLETAAIQAGYGETISAASVQKLVDAIVSYQTDSVRMIAEAQQKATDNAAAVTQVVEDGKRRYREALEAFVKPAEKAPSPLPA